MISLEELEERYGKLECPREHRDGTPHKRESIKIEVLKDDNDKVTQYIVYCAEPTPDEIVFKKCMYHFSLRVKC